MTLAHTTASCVLANHLVRPPPHAYSPDFADVNRHHHRRPEPQVPAVCSVAVTPIIYLDQTPAMLRFFFSNARDPHWTKHFRIVVIPEGYITCFFTAPISVVFRINPDFLFLISPHFSPLFIPRELTIREGSSTLACWKSARIYCTAFNQLVSLSLGGGWKAYISLIPQATTDTP